MKRIIVLALAIISLTAAKAQTLHYDRPAEFFEEALVIGNGRLGGIVYGGTKSDRISLNDITLWTGEPDRGTVNPDAHTHLKEIREALDKEDYEKARQLSGLLQGHESEKYQPLGTLYIDYDDDATISDYGRSLNLSTATAETHYLRNGKEFTTNYFVSSPDSVIVIRLTSKAKEGINALIRMETEQPHQQQVVKGNIVTTGYVGYAANAFYLTGEHKEQFFYDEKRGIHFRTVVNAVNDGGTITEEEKGLRLTGCKEVLIIIGNATSFNGPDKDPVKEGRPYTRDVKRVMGNATKKDYANLLNAHIADYQSLYNRVTLDLGKTDEKIKVLPTDKQLFNYTEKGEKNPELEATYFQYGRYLLISSSRTPGVPANLQGLWNEYMSAPWRSNYTVNINLEENYWGAETTNLHEMNQSLMDFIRNMQRTGMITARNFYGVNKGWCSGHNSDIWAMTNPVGEGKGDPQWANWTMGGAWLSTHIWENYEFSQDKQFLSDYYPTLKGAAEFCLNWLVDKNGELITSPSTSPENEFITDTGFKSSFFYGGTADLAIIRECVGDAVKAAKVLGVDNGFCNEANQKLSHLHPYKIGKRGQLLEWYHDWNDADWTHRHQSHLIGLFPGHQITLENTPELARAAARSLEIKGDKTTGWSTGWRINLLARLQDNKSAYHMVRTLLKYVSPDKYEGPDYRNGGGTYPNLLDAHSPFQIDGNFGGSAGIAEMLLQSTDDTITLLPACPDDWKDGSFTGLCARGGFVVDLNWQNGKVVSATITSREGGTTIVKANSKEYKVTLAKGEKKKII